MTVSYTPSNGPNRNKEILDEIGELLGADDPAKVKLIHDQVRQANKRYEKRLFAPNIPMKKARKEYKGLLRKLEEFGAARWYGSATFNPFDEAPEARSRDQRFRELCDELIGELRHRLNCWPQAAGPVKTREYAEGAPKAYLATVAVELVVQYLPNRLSKTDGGITYKIAELLYEIATGQPGHDSGVGMLRHVRIAVDQYRVATKTNH